MSVAVVWTLNHSGFIDGFNVHPTNAQGLYEIAVHRVFVQVETYLHRWAFARASRCSRAMRLYNSSSAAISASIASRLA